MGTLTGPVSAAYDEAFDEERFSGDFKEVVIHEKVQEVVRIGFGHCAVDEFGQPLSLSKMRKPFCIAELKVHLPMRWCACAMHELPCIAAGSSVPDFPPYFQENDECRFS